VPSVRHHGRYHTGEDWYGGRGSSLGQPVRAAAAGRVTFTSATAWGRDGGVVILEHRLPDDTIAYSVYGHLMETPEIPLPAALSCVPAGAVIGAVGDARPAPHVHFEIKVNDPTLPGSGYSWLDPFSQGWRRPEKFVRNWQAWLHPAHNWHFMANDERGPQTPPVVLDDNSLIYLDSNRLGRLTPDGRLLWRVVLEQPATALVPFADTALVVYAGGEFQPVARDGTLGARWPLPFAPDSAPLALGELLVFHTRDNALVAIEVAERVVRWTLPDVPRVARWHAAGGLLGLVTDAGVVMIVSSGGELVDTARVRDGAAFATSPDGGLLVFTSGGLWRVRPDGTWAEFLATEAAGGRSSAVAFGPGGGLYLFDGEIVQAFGGSSLVWQAALPRIDGLTRLDVYDSVLLLTSNHGHVIALQAATGGLCNATQVYGSDRAGFWHGLGTDGVLRLAVADQFMGLDWEDFLGACR